MSSSTADVVIVGGGIVGAATAFFLTRAGVPDVLLVEREGLACGATGICPGGIRQQFSGEPDCRLARNSMRFWNEINSILEPEEPFLFERSGYLFLADSESQLSHYRNNVKMQNQLGIPSEILTPQQIGKILPKLRLEKVVGASWCREDGFLEDCHGVTHWLFRRAGQGGARLLASEVRELRPGERGWQVLTPNGTVSCDSVVLAAGIDTATLAEPLGLVLPIRRVRRRLAFTEPVPERLMAPLVVAPERGFAGKQLSYGVFYLGWLNETGAEDDLDFLEEGLTAGASLLPLLADLPVRRILAGDYDQTPDSRPILGTVDGLDGLYLAAGFSGHGYMIAPAVGEALAQLISGEASPLSIEAFSFARFEHGSDHEGLVI